MRRILVSLAAAILIGGLASAQSDYDLATDSDGNPLSPETALEGCLYQAMLGRGTEEDCIGIMYEYCPENAGTTVEMLGCIEPEIQFWDQKLNSAYGDLINVYEEQDSDFEDVRALAPRLRNVQLQWIDWRDAKCGFAYDQYRGGTIGRLTNANCRLEETAKRALEIQDLLVEARM